MPAKRSGGGRKATKRVRSPAGAVGLRRLAREVARLTRVLDEARARHAKQLAAVRRAADRRVASMMREIAALRHHEARAEALGRLLAEREAAATPQPAGDGGAEPSPR